MGMMFVLYAHNNWRCDRGTSNLSSKLLGIEYNSHGIEP